MTQKFLSYYRSGESLEGVNEYSTGTDWNLRVKAGRRAHQTDGNMKGLVSKG